MAASSLRKQLLSALARWQALLGLEDWRVTLRLRNDPAIYGDIEWRHDRKTATLTISPAITP